MELVDTMRCAALAPTYEAVIVLIAALPSAAIVVNESAVD